MRSEARMSCVWRVAHAFVWGVGVDAIPTCVCMHMYVQPRAVKTHFMANPFLAAFFIEGKVPQIFNKDAAASKLALEAWKPRACTLGGAWAPP